MRVRGPIAAVAVLASAVGLGGCGPAGSEVAIDELAVPASLQPAGPVVDDASIVSPTTDLPWLVSAIRTEPGGTPHAAVWTSGKDGTFAAEPVLLDVRGSVRTLAAAGDGGSTAVAGSVWTGRAEHAFLLRSTDRATWTPVDLPAEVGTAQLSEAAAVDGAVVAVGVDPARHVVTGVRVGRDGEVAAFGEIEGKGRPTVVGIAGQGSALVLAAEWDRGPGEPVTTTYRSADQGATWRPVKVPGDGASVAGVGVTEQGFTLTGSVRAGEGSRYTEPAVWTWEFGDDGWELLTFKITGDVDSSLELADPATGEGPIAAVLWGESLGRPALVVEDDDFLGSSGTGPATGGVGHTGPSAWAADGGTVRAVLTGDGGARVMQVTGDEWSEVSVLADVQRWFAPDGAVHPDGGTLPVSGIGFEPNDDGGWWRWTRSTALAPDVDGTALVEADDRPEEVTQDADVARDVAPDGTEVLVATSWSEDRESIASTPYVRAADNGSWVAGEPLSAGSASGVAAVRWVPGLGEGGSWLAVGHQADDTDIEATDRVAAWTSPDGATWTDVSASLDDGSAAGFACLLPDGAPLVLGATFADGRWVDVAWSVDGDGWTRTTIDEDDALDVEVCLDATGDRGTVLQVTSAGRSELRTTTDGVSFETLATSGDGITFGPVAAVGDGIAAVGTTVTPGTAETTLWYSADGVTWGRRALPATVPATGTVHPVGDGDAVVAVADPGGVEAWYVTDVADFVGGSPQQVDLSAPAED